MLGRIVRIVRWPLGLLLVGAIAWISWYGYARGFGRRWRGMLEKEFDRYGLSIDVSKLTLDPFHGLIARDVAEGTRPTSEEVKGPRTSAPPQALATTPIARGATDRRDARGCGA